MTDPSAVKVQKLVPASRKAVFEAWLDPHALGRFMKPAKEMPDCEVEIDPVEGGRFKIVMKAGDTDIPIDGVFKTIRRHDLLVFSWLSNRTIPDSTVTLTFEELGPKSTRLTLVHTGFPDDQARADHEAGWNAIVSQLATEFD